MHGTVHYTSLMATH